MFRGRVWQEAEEETDYDAHKLLMCRVANVADILPHVATHSLCNIAGELLLLLLSWLLLLLLLAERQAVDGCNLSCHVPLCGMPNQQSTNATKLFDDSPTQGRLLLRQRRDEMS